MSTQVLLFRGINVGGKNKVSMQELRDWLENDIGCSNVATYLGSGQAIVDTTLSGSALATKVENGLVKRFHLDDELIRVIAISPAKLRKVVSDRPKGFGDQPTVYHSDAIFLMGVKVGPTMKVFSPREGVDAVWPGNGVVYSQRLSAQRTNSRLGRITSDPAYKSMTIRSWATTTKLIAMLDAREKAD